MRGESACPELLARIRQLEEETMLGSCSTFVVAWSRPNTADGALSAIQLPETCQA